MKKIGYFLISRVDAVNVNAQEEPVVSVSSWEDITLVPGAAKSSVLRMEDGSVVATDRRNLAYDPKDDLGEYGQGDTLLLTWRGTNQYIPGGVYIIGDVFIEHPQKEFHLKVYKDLPETLDQKVVRAAARIYERQLKDPIEALIRGF